MSTTTRPVQHRPPVVLGPELPEVRSGRATALILGLAVALVVIAMVGHMPKSWQSTPLLSHIPSLAIVR